MRSLALVPLFGLLALTACEEESLEAPEYADVDQNMLYGLSSNYWGNTDINVCWESSGYTTEKGWIEDELTGADSWANFANITFTGWGNCTTSSDGIRITASTNMQVDGGLGERSDGTSRMQLDFQSSSPQTRWTRCVENSLSRENCLRAVALHEFGHALGFAHEQNRNDTPSECTDAPQGSNGDTNIGDWDAESIMNYCSTSTTLSVGDQHGVISAYGGPFPGWSSCSSTNPCPTGVGDCDSDSECADEQGETCVTDVGALYGWSSTVDVCVAPDDLPFPGWSYCSASSPCPHGFGDCDSDAECQAGTICMHDVGDLHGWDGTADLCVQTETWSSYDRCSTSNPCSAGIGECDSNAECQSGTVSRGVDLAPAVERSHGEVYAALAVKLRHRLSGRQELEARRTAHAECGNLRVACSRAVARGDVEVAVQTAFVAVATLRAHGAASSARTVASAVCELPGATHAQEALAWYSRGGALMSVDADEARDAFNRSAEHAAACGDHVTLTNALRLLGRAWLDLGDADRAAEAMDGALDVCREPGLRGMVQCDRTVLAVFRGQLDEAQALLDEAITALWEEGWPGAMALASGHQVTLLARRGEVEAAEQAAHRAIEAYLDVGDLTNANLVRGELAHLHALQGDHEAAAALYEVQIASHRRMGVDCLLPAPLAALAHEYQELGRLREAEPLLLEAITLGRVSSNMVALASATSMLGRLRMHQGRHAEGMALLRKAVEGARRAARPVPYRDALFALLEGLRTCEARQELDQQLGVWQEHCRDQYVPPIMQAGVEAFERWLGVATTS